MKDALELLKKDLEHYGNCDGNLDGISFTIVAHLLRVFIRRIEEDQGIRTPGRAFDIGPQTMERVFRPNGITNVSDLQSVFNAIEKALTEPTPVSKKKPDWRDPFCKRRDENVLSNIRDAYFYGFEDALEIVAENPTPAPKAEPAWKPIPWDGKIDFPTTERMVLVRKISDKLNGVGQPVFHIEMAYRTVSHTWLTAASQPVGSFEEWCEIPK
jgi:hypothetical protein